ncbi:uncharacterized protein LOC142173590 [Nicotiana tabacum]|uniref:Uncharacterized protein LOC142173590 n=1 Tax=Nicotiana tabacum TaxID=4097 RepID=A0AC58TDL3_TOBAC
MRGINKRYKQKELAKYLKENIIKIAELVETRVKEHRAQAVYNKIVPCWGFENNYSHVHNGRIWLIWDTNAYKIEVLKKEAQIIYYQCPMMIATNVREPRIRTAFKFFNVWATHENFLLLVEENWKQKFHLHKMRNILLKQKELRENLKRLNEIEFKGVATRIIQAKEDLQEIQLKIRHQYSDELAMEEKKIICQLEKLSMIEESAVQQKARARWIKLGDANTNYFSAVIKDRKQKKQILELESQEGGRLTETRDIKMEIIQFYKSLMGSALHNMTAVSKTITRNGNVLNHTQQLQICEDMTEEEIYLGLQSIGDDKAPGVDGYNIVFYKRAWPVIKSEISEAVQDFFRTSKIYKGINCTSVTLILKVANLATIKEYRPFSCCTVLYKIITKILASRI